jgi:hypothetical protein
VGDRGPDPGRTKRPSVGCGRNSTRQATASRRAKRIEKLEAELERLRAEEQQTPGDGDAP